LKANVDIELGNDTAKSLTDIELAGEFKILLKQGEKLNFVYTANSTPKTILIICIPKKTKIYYLE